MAKIPEKVLDILGECSADGNVIYLPPVQIDRKDYAAVNKVLENMGGKWDRKAKGHIFAAGDDAGAMLEAVLLTQEVRDLKKEYQFFPTPRTIAKKMCDWAEITYDSDVLEPSCGNGQLADVICEYQPASLTCYELNEQMKKYLDSKEYGVNYADFLSVTKSDVEPIDRIVMNPPFTRHQDIDHVRHAYELLDDGGILVSVMSESAFFRSDRKSVAFRNFLTGVGAEIIELDTGAFHESGTDIKTRIIKIRK